MLVSTEMELEGAKVVREIGRISAVSGWHGSNCDCGAHRSKALEALVMVAKDYEADAIIGLDYSTDGARAVDLAELPIERVAVSGIAVKLARN
jgi:uncharacterized protein YbjQ (UPF0145 family)